jgi:hypothetical protein
MKMMTEYKVAVNANMSKILKKLKKKIDSFTTLF